MTIYKSTVEKHMHVVIKYTPLKLVSLRNHFVKIMHYSDANNSRSQQ